MKRRANARAIFEGYCESKLDKEEPSYAEMYNKETIIERTWESVLLLARTIEGRIGDKPKAGGLSHLFLCRKLH